MLGFGGYLKLNVVLVNVKTAVTGRKPTYLNMVKFSPVAARRCAGSYQLIVNVKNSNRTEQ